MPGTLARKNLQFALGIRIADPVIEAAPLERVVHFAGAVGRDDDDRRLRRLDGAEFRHGHLEIGQHFEQKRLERFVGAVDFVDQQHRRPGGIGLERLQQRPLDQKALGKTSCSMRAAVALAFRFRQADGDHLRAVIPLVDRGRNVEPFVALQPDQPAPERRRQHLGDLGLADAGLAFEEQRPAHAQREITAPSPASGRRCSRPWPAVRGWPRSNSGQGHCLLMRGLYPTTRVSYMWGSKAPSSQDEPMTKPETLEKDRPALAHHRSRGTDRPCPSEGRRPAGALWISIAGCWVLRSPPAGPARPSYRPAAIIIIIGLNTWESHGGSPPPPGTTGLYHTAILYPTRQLLADALRRLIVAKIPLEGASDHGVSEALYLRDPDDNGVELYWDRPKEQWPKKADGSLQMFTHPLDLHDLLANSIARQLELVRLRAANRLNSQAHIRQRCRDQYDN